jgi:hypothetical protein
MLEVDDWELAMEHRESNSRTEWAELRALLGALRDEIRLKLHLGGMDLRDAWQQIEPEVDSLLAKARRSTAAKLAQARSLIPRLMGFRDRLESGDRAGRPPD